MNKASIYARFSSSKQREESIEGQLRICREWCQRNGYEVVAEYCDRAMSGRTDQRPEFQRMVANAGESDIVLVYMMDRFSRDPYDAPIYKRELSKKGVRVVSAMENVPDTPEGMLLDKLLEGMAAMESAKNSERTRRGMKENALKCQWNGNRVYGYAADPATKRYVVDEQQAANVRDAFSMRLGGMNPSAIASELAARGVLTYRGRPCSATMVENMLRNERYAGVYIWGDVRVDGGMPAIVTHDEWVRVQSAPRAKRRKLETWRDYPLAGKAACACGAPIVGKCSHGNGGVYHYYTCSARCGVRAVRADWLEESIVDAVRTLLDGPVAVEVAQAVVSYMSGGEAASRRDSARAALRDAEKSIANLLDAVERVGYVEGLRERMDAATERRDRARRDLLLMDDEVPSVGDVVEFLRFGATLDGAAVLDAFVGRVEVGTDRVGVTLNYMDPDAKRPAYLEVDGCAESGYGSPDGELCAPTIRVVGATVWLLIPRAA